MSSNIQTIAPPSYRTPVSLLGRIRNHDQLAWEHFYAVYLPLIRHVCLRWGVQSNDIDDIAQEVFQAVLANIDTYQRDKDGQVRTFRNWLGGIIRNKIRGHYQVKASQPAAEGGSEAQQRLQQLTAPEDAEEEPDREVYQLVCLQALGRIRQEFAPQHWQAFWRMSVDGQPAPAVAAELNMTSAAVRQAKSRILRRLREELGEVSE